MAKGFRVEELLGVKYKGLRVEKREEGLRVEG
jgi:hypothetical protein